MEAIEIRQLDIELSPRDKDFSNGEDDTGLNVQGYIAVNSPSHILGKEGSKKWREIIEPGTFKNALAKARRLKQDIDFLSEHDNKKILASTSNKSLFLEEDDIGLYIDAKISETSWGKDLYVLVKDGIIKGLSFGMKVLQEDWTMSADGLPLRTIHDIELFEISALKVPAYPLTLLESRGLEVTEIEIPDDLEKRDLQGGNNMLGENQEVTPQMMYNGMTLIAEKLDAIVIKMDTIEVDKTLKGLEDAKLVLAQVQAVADAAVGKPAIEGEAIAVEGEKVVDPETGEEVIAEDGETLPIEEDTANEGVETKAAAEGVETETVDGETKPAEEDPNAQVETKAKVAGEGEVPPVVPAEKEVVPDGEKVETEEEKKKRLAMAEVRSWLNETIIMEVPENE